MLLKMSKSFAFFSLLSVIILYIGFSLNLYKATDYDYYSDCQYSFMKNSKLFSDIFTEDIFLTFDRWDESLVIGRLVKSRKDGLLSSGGFAGNFCDNFIIPESLAGVNELRFRHAYQYRLYLNESLDSEVNQFMPYMSQFGGQAILLSILDRIMIGNNSSKLKFFYHLMAAMSAVIIFIIILWFAKEYGLLTGWLLTISFSLFCYPTLYAKSLWWIFFAFYVPFLIFLYMLRKEEKSLRRLSNVKFIVAGFFSMIIKIFFNGYEFITTTVLMPFIPLLYYSIKNKWNAHLLLIRSVFSVCGISLAITISLLLLSLQFVVAGGRFEDGLNNIKEKFLYRTQISRTTGHELWSVQRSKTELSEIIKNYILHSDVLRLQNFGINHTLTIKDFLIIFILITFILIFDIKFIKKEVIPSDIKALIISHWLAIIPPLSWLVIFRQHSVIHMREDPIVWYMPYMFYGVALFGIFIKKIVIINLNVVPGAHGFDLPPEN